MLCVQDHLKLALMTSFLSCMVAAENGSKSHYLAWQSARGPLLSLTCACGLACTLVYSKEATALLWASRCLTDPRGAVLGAIHSGTLITCFYPSNIVTTDPVDRRELLREAQEQSREYQRMTTRHLADGTKP